MGVNMSNKFFNITDLNNSWVITKRHNGNIFFKRKQYVTCNKNYPDKDCLFINEASVKEEVARLNSTRKKCKYGYENASKYFVNLWSFNYWQGTVIKNKPLAIKDVNKDTRLPNIETVKKELELKLKDSIKSKADYVERYQKELPKRIEEITKEYTRYINDYAKEKTNLELELQELTTLDAEKFIEPYETQGDKMVKVLYGKV
jgi:hypothetical protein